MSFLAIPVVLNIAIQEIALEGLRGCNFAQVLKLLQQHRSKDINSLVFTDIYVQRMLWVALLRSADRLDFYSQSAGAAGADAQDSGNVNPYSSDGFLEPSIRARRKAVDETVRLELINLLTQPPAPAAATAATPAPLQGTEAIILVAKPKIRYDILCMTLVDRNVNDVQYCIVEAAARSRNEGIYQSALGKELMIEAKNVNYHLKLLCGTLQLLQKESAFDRKLHVATNLVRHCRFVATGDTAARIERKETAQNKGKQSLPKREFKDLDIEVYEDFKEMQAQIVPLLEELLKDRNDRMALEKDIRNHFGFPYSTRLMKHKWERMRQTILKSGKFKLLRATVSTKHSAAISRCKEVNVLKLLSPEEQQAAAGQSSASAAAAAAAVDEEEETAAEEEVKGFCAEMPQLHQVYSFIASSKERVAHPQIYGSFQIDPKRSQMIVNELKTDYGVLGVAEKIGKQSVYLYTVPAADKLVSSSSQSADASTAQQEEEVIEAIEEPQQPMDETTDGATAADPAAPAPEGTEQEQGEAAAASAAAATPEQQQQNRLYQPIVSDAPQQGREVSAFSKSLSHTNKVVTKQLLERVDALMAIVREHRIITRAEVHNICKRNPAQAKMFQWSSTLKNTIGYMERQNIVKRLSVSVPTLQGTYTQHTILMIPELSQEHQEVKEFIKNLRPRTVSHTPIAAERVDLDSVERIESAEAAEAARLAARPKKQAVYTRTAANAYWCIQNGYYIAKMLRTKAFHLCLFQLYALPENHLLPPAATSEAEQPDLALSKSFTIYDIVQDMNLQQYGQIIGIGFELSAELMTEHALTRVADLPTELRTKVAGETKLGFFRTRVQTLIERLIRLGLAEMSGGTQQSPSVRLLRTVRLPAFMTFTVTQPRFDLRTLRDAERYWVTFESYCVKEDENVCKGDLTMRAGDDSDQEDDAEDQAEEEEEEGNKKQKKRRKKQKKIVTNSIFDELGELRAVRWTEIRLYTVRQLRVLEEQHKTDPKPSIEACFKLARQLLLPFEKVAIYFFRHRQTILQQRITSEGQETMMKLRQRRSRFGFSGRKARTTQKTQRHAGAKSYRRMALDEEDSDEFESSDEDDSEEYDSDENDSEESSEEEDSQDEAGKQQQHHRTSSSQPSTPMPRPLSLSQYAAAELQNVLSKTGAQGMASHAKAYRKRKAAQQVAAAEAIAKASVQSQNQEDEEQTASASDAVTKKKSKKKQATDDEEGTTPAPVQRIRWTQDEDLLLMQAIVFHRELELDGKAFVRRPIEWEKALKNSGLQRNATQCSKRYTAINRMPHLHNGMLAAAIFRQLSMSMRQGQPAATAEGEAGAASASSPVSDEEIRNQVLQILKDYRDNKVQQQAQAVNQLGETDPALASGIIASAPQQAAALHLVQIKSNIVLPDLPKDSRLFSNHFEILYRSNEEVLRDAANAKETSAAALELTGTITADYVRQFCLQTLIKIIVMTSEEDYHVQPAYKLIERYVGEEVARAMESLKQTGFLVRQKSRGFSMRGYSIRNTVVQTLWTLGKMPEALIEDLERFHRRVSVVESTQEAEQPQEDEEDLKNEQPMRRLIPVGLTEMQQQNTAQDQDQDIPMVSGGSGGEEVIEVEYKEVLYFNPLCTGGEVAASLSMLASDKLRFDPQFERGFINGAEQATSVSTPAEDEEQQGGTRQPKKSVNAGLASHLMGLGGLETEENPQLGDQFRNLRLPAWDIRIRLTREPNDGIEELVRNITGKKRAREDDSNDAESTAAAAAETASSEAEDLPPAAKRARLGTPSSAPSTPVTPLPSGEVASALELALAPLVQRHSELKAVLLFAIQNSTTHQVDDIACVYDLIDEAMGAGITPQLLYEKMHQLRPRVQAKDIDSILVLFMNFEVVRRMDLRYTTVYLADKHSQLYKILPFEVDRAAFVYDATSSLMLDKPWINLKGQLNRDLLESIKATIVEKISLRPGISLKTLVGEYSMVQGALEPMQIVRLLEQLEADDIIKSKCFATKKVSLFSKAKNSAPQVVAETESIGTYLVEKNGLRKCFWSCADSLLKTSVSAATASQMTQNIET